MQVLVTGGAGYIGSHTMVELLLAGYDVVCVDSLANGSFEAINRVEAVTGKKVLFYPYDLRDKQKLQSVFCEQKIDAVIHFAGLKAVSESAEKPLEYYANNIGMTLTLCEVMNMYNCKQFVFSSSATVYGNPVTGPLSEDAPVAPCTPYGRTKLMIEQILQDLYDSDSEWRVVCLRYFNPIGAHVSGLIGEDPRGVPNNLLPFLSQVAVGKREKLLVFGGDYSTPDGTGIRDYVHVTDLAKGHVCALERGLTYAATQKNVLTINLGTGCGYSVLDIIKAFEASTGVRIPYVITDRRLGDIAMCYADVRRAFKVLGWSANLGIEQMCKDVWRWQSKNPYGYENKHMVKSI